MRLPNIVHQLVFIKRLLSDPNGHWSFYLTEFYCGESLSGFHPATTLSFQHSAAVYIRVTRGKHIQAAFTDHFSKLVWTDLGKYSS